MNVCRMEWRDETRLLDGTCRFRVLNRCELELSTREFMICLRTKYHVPGSAVGRRAMGEGVLEIGGLLAQHAGCEGCALWPCSMRGGRRRQLSSG